MNNKYLYPIVRKGVIASSLLIFMACGGNTSEQPTDGAALMEDTIAEEEEADKVVYYATPSMVEIAAVIKSTGANFSSDVLNKTENKKNYTTNYKRAVNMGVYGADLAYSAMFEETQSAINYLRTVKEMTDEMGMDGVFEASLLEQIESNIADRDALLGIISDFYWSADSYLEDNDRGEVASLVVVGGWIEATYISTTMALNSPKNVEIRNRIAEQKLILKNLIMLMGSKSEGNDAEAKKLLADLKSIKAILDKVGIENSTGKVISDEANQETEIQNTSNIAMSEELLNELNKEVTAIRNEIIK
jgi:polyhydroxyalkanoate synthesis regulator phasin